MKFYYPFQVLMAILGMMFPAPMFGGDRPASAPPIDQRLTGIESRLDALEAAVFKSTTTEATTEAKAECQCPDDGPCICPADLCDCPDCPEHKKTKSVNGRTVKRIGDRVACYQDGNLVLYLAGSRLDERASEWLNRSQSTSQVVNRREAGHTHTCRSCGTSFSHSNAMQGNAAAHTCPGCGRLEYGNITNRWSGSRSFRPAVRVTQPRSTGGYWTTRCENGFCRRVWVSN